MIPQRNPPRPLRTRSKVLMTPGSCSARLAPQQVPRGSPPCRPWLGAGLRKSNCSSEISPIPSPGSPRHFDLGPKEFVKMGPAELLSSPELQAGHPSRWALGSIRSGDRPTEITAALPSEASTCPWPLSSAALNPSPGLRLGHVWPSLDSGKTAGVGTVSAGLPSSLAASPLLTSP